MATALCSTMVICTIFYTGSAWHHGELWSCTMTFQSLPPEVAANLANCPKQDLGSIGTVGGSKPFPGKRGLLPPDLLGPVQMVLQRSPMDGESLSQWDGQRRLSISGLVLSVHIHVDAQGQKAPFKEGASWSCCPARGSPKLCFSCFIPFFFVVGLVLGLFTKMYFV